MATINTFDDLVRALDENPEWVEALRSRVLTKELLGLPEAFAQFASQTNRRVDRLEAAMAQLTEAVTRQEAAMAQLTETVADIARRSNRMEIDIGRMKGHDARNAVQADGGRRIARSMKLRRTRVLDVDEIWDLTLDNDVGDIRAGDIESFREADLIMEAADSDGQRHYVAVEVSYSVNGRDADRALRNAQLMRRFTAQSAYAAVAGTRVNNRVQEMIDGGLVHWYRILDKDIEPN